jgi:para-nitrobenzyl esterase
MSNHSIESAIVQTTAGKVRGAISDGVCVFKGISYGASTSGANRFMPPQRPAPWPGVRDALAYGPMAMQDFVPPTWWWSALHKGNITTEGHERSEDCLVLNVWTPAVNDGKKRPVMVWCHGGSYTSFMGDADWHDGAYLARQHDVVVLHFNHRLNVFGFLYLAELGGEKYADSGNVGMLDIVAVLEWVRDNIERFGGDPRNVTIFGESGGGSKVTTLLAMPAAKGLFHKAIVQSGHPLLRVCTAEDATRTAKTILDRLGLDPKHIDGIQELPPERLLQAWAAVAASQPHIWGLIHALAPVVDGRSLPRHPFDPDAPPISAHVPMMIGTTSDECGGFFLNEVEKLPALDRAGLYQELQHLGVPRAKADKLIETYQAARRGQTPGDLLRAISSDRMFGMEATQQAQRKSAQAAAPAYLYFFAWEAPGNFKAGHGLEVPFVFGNLDKAPGLRSPDPDPRLDELEEKISTAWVAFARHGNPNHPGLPQWKPYDVNERATMVFDYECKLVNDPDREVRLAMEAVDDGWNTEWWRSA